MDGAQLLLEAPPATQAWVAKRFGRILETCARSVIGPAITVAFAGASARSAAGARTGSLPELDISEGFNPRYSFDQFIIGDGNRLAHAAALAVAEIPGQAYNPLFLHAPPGLGKTHLLHAIGNFVVAFGGGATVRYTTVESFTNNFISALGSRSLERFKHAYRDADVLLIDDVQFLASKAKTEEEFFHTFNALYETGRQLVLTCDRLPRQLVTVEERLRERFESGLVADIRPPDFATRVAILRKRAALDEIDVADVRVLELIAERVTDNIRTLEGALIRIVAHQSLTNRPLDLALAADVLEGIHPALPKGTPSIGEIQTAVASYFEISVDDLVSASRAARVAWPRQVAIHLARELTDASLQDIGGAFGGRNHATVLHACKRVSERAGSAPESSTELRELTQQLQDRSADRGC
jgi:chromosomal replication initiator protein